MVRITPIVLSGLVILGVVVGCANFVETQAITNFTAALDKKDADKLNAVTSDSFKKNALRGKDAIDSLKKLPLHPDEKVTILKVKDVSDNKKKVEVRTQRTHRKMEYQLVRDPKSDKWVVDDIYVKQRGVDVDAAKSVTEQMDLLLDVQNFLRAWHDGKRDEVTSVTTSSFAKLLTALPPSHLQRLTKKVAGEKIPFEPRATINVHDAVVRLQRRKGILILTMKETKKGWKVADVAVESLKQEDKDYLASARRTATAILTVVDFLKAYKDDDKAGLKKVTATHFFEECLNVADLKEIPLPNVEVLGDKDVVKTLDKGGEYLIRRGQETVKISLATASTEVAPAADGTYVVDNVTLYDTKQEKRLSALFTADAKMQLFMKALSRGNLTLVRKNSTADLKARVWNRLQEGPVTLSDILPHEIELATPVIGGRDFHDSAIRIHVHQGSRELTYIMRDWAGEVTVDDVLMPVMDRPSSMKETMQIMLPIRFFQAALRDASSSNEAHDAQLQILKSVTSNDFNRVVWSQLNQIPEAAFAVLPHLDLPLNTVTDTPTGHTIVLGDDRFGARIDLNRERESLVIDRIYLITDPQSEPSELKRSLKSQLAKRGPRGLALDPISSYPIATDPPKSADAEAGDPVPAGGTSGVIPAVQEEPAGGAQPSSPKSSKGR